MRNPEENGLYIPKFVVYTLTLLGIIDNVVSFSVEFIFGILFHYLEEEESSHIQENQTPAPSKPPLSAILIREILPTTKFFGVVLIQQSSKACNNGGIGGDEEAASECAVCLNEFEDDEEIRCLKNCRHYFHRGCIDRWMDEERKTCPLCRKFLVPIDSRLEFDRTLWAAY